MGLTENLVEAKTELNNLLDFANAKTGEADTTLGDAVKRLCDGFGQGGIENRLTVQITSKKSNGQQIKSAIVSEINLRFGDGYHPFIACLSHTDNPETDYKCMAVIKLSEYAMSVVTSKAYNTLYVRVSNNKMEPNAILVDNYSCVADVGDVFDVIVLN